MLSAGQHPVNCEAAHERSSASCHFLRVAAEGASAEDGFGKRCEQIENRRQVGIETQKFHARAD
jgi:hypothetical protein